jgi:heptosyltransferase-2
LADYMPGVRKTIVVDFPRRRLGVAQQRQLAGRIANGDYSQALVMSRKWKAALAPWVAGVPLRTGFAGEMRFGLLNDIRFGERKLARMIDRMGALALPRGATLPTEWPLPELRIPAEELSHWRANNRLPEQTNPIVALCPGAVGAGKAWPASHYAALARDLTADGASVWVLGGPNEGPIARKIAQASYGGVRDFTGHDLRDAILALAAADVSVTNDSGLMHVSAAIGTPTIAIFGPTSPWHQKPLNPLAAILEPPGDQAASQRARTEGNHAVAHRRTDDVAPTAVRAAVQAALGGRLDPPFRRSKTL